MPYPSTRYRDMTPKMEAAFKDSFLKQLDEAVRDLNPDLILCHHLFLLTAIVREHFPDRKVFGFCHNTDLRQLQKTDLEREYITGQIRRLDRIFALHAEQKRTSQDIYDVPKEKIQVIGMGYNSHIFKNESLRVNDGVTRIAFAGKISVKKGTASYALSSMLIESPCLWSPEDPYLYDLDIMVHNEQGKVIDGYRQRVGIRSIEFKQNEGLWINGKPYDGKLMGTNRHQDFAVLGNALPNSMQWRDAKNLRDAGLKVIRTHYVIDPAFMDACDELGVFALVEVPGWQFWNNESVFGERVYSDIRNMIRIHRNHASLFFWEPILNETHYPDEFAKKAMDICEEEYPYPYSIAACDHGAAGDHYFSLLLRPIESDLRDDKTYFIREWGDNVDDWNAQNSDSRVARGWGEVPMLIQAEHYANPSYIKKYPILCYETICNKPKQIVGACF